MFILLAWTREASLALSEEPRPVAVTQGNETTKINKVNRHFLLINLGKNIFIFSQRILTAISATFIFQPEDWRNAELAANFITKSITEDKPFLLYYGYKIYFKFYFKLLKLMVI